MSLLAFPYATNFTRVRAILWMFWMNVSIQRQNHTESIQRLHTAGRNKHVFLETWTIFRWQIPWIWTIPVMNRLKCRKQAFLLKFCDEMQRKFKPNSEHLCQSARVLILYNFVSMCFVLFVANQLAMKKSTEFSKWFTITWKDKKIAKRFSNVIKTADQSMRWSKRLPSTNQFW